MKLQPKVGYGGKVTTSTNLPNGLNGREADLRY